MSLHVVSSVRRGEQTYFWDFKRLISLPFFALNSLDLLTKLFKSPLCDFNSPGHDEHDVQEKNRSPYRRTI